MTGYAHEIAAAAERFKLDPVLVEAVVLTESAGRTHAYRYEPQFYAAFCALVAPLGVGRDEGMLAEAAAQLGRHAGRMAQLEADHARGQR